MNTGRIVVVTGAASGIGEACARRFHQDGDIVVIADRNLEGARRVVDTLNALPVPTGSGPRTDEARGSMGQADKNGQPRAHAVYIDLGDETSVQAAAQEIANRIGAVRVLVNCAGVLQRTLPPEELSMKEWDIVARIDLRGTYLACVAFGSAMAERGGGAIVNIASVAGMRSGPLHSYGPAKAGVISLGEGLAAEWGRKGVRVNTVSPGFTQTPALERGVAVGNLDATHMIASKALGRLVRPEEIAAAVAFLASDQASAITGVNLPVDAGFLVATPWMGFGGLR
ncbi:MAG: SDR family NAD(P)-dependent oxidoreductase [Burkholderiales bacterium]|jgi:NAD(P)-dependent dehydrogenase (short-subunit alcohol dehydrogenase family)